MTPDLTLVLSFSPPFVELGGAGYWVDGSDQVTEGDWRYDSGQPVPMGTPFWKATTSLQQPDNDSDGDCLQLCYNCAYYMNDVPCSNQYRIVCEKDHQFVPIGMTILLDFYDFVLNNTYDYKRLHEDKVIV